MILLTLLFCSSIFTSYISILNSINNFDDNIYGTQEDVIIIKDDQSNTPFTSTIPKSYSPILAQIDGVVAVSPEYYIPGVVKSRNVFLRGINPDQFTKITQYQIIEGSDVSQRDLAGVIVGKNLASNYGYSVGDTIKFEGTLKNSAGLLQIIGIFESNLDNFNSEIFSSLELASKFIRLDNYYNHIRVKYDRDIITPNDIFDLISTKFQISIQTSWKGQIVTGIWELKIFDIDDNLLHFKNETGIVGLELPFGQYLLEAKVNSTSTGKKDIFVDNDKTITLNFVDKFYNISLRTFYGNEPRSMSIIISQNDQIIHNGITNQTGHLEIQLLKTVHKVNVSYGIIERQFILNVDMNKAFNLTIDEISKMIKIRGMRNGTILTKNTNSLIFDSYLSNPLISAFLDSQIVEIENNVLPYDLLNGSHNLIFVNKNSNETLLYFNFKIEPDYEPLEPFGMTEYSHHTPSSEISLISLGLSYDDPISVRMLNYTLSFIKRDSTLVVNLPNTIGLIELTITGFSPLGKFVNISRYFFISEEPQVAGILFKSVENLIVLENSTIPIWYSEPLNSISINSQQINIKNNSIKIPEISSTGDYTLIFETEDKVETIDLTIMRSFGSYVQLSNNTLSGTLENNINWVDDNLIITFDSNLFDLNISYGTNEISVYSNQTIPLQLNQTILDQISVTSKLSDRTQNFNIDITIKGNSFVPIPKLKIGRFIADGIFSNILTNKSDSWSINLIQNFTKFVNFSLLANNNYQLPPGIWEINLLSINGANISREVIVPKWTNALSVSNSIVSTKYGSIVIKNVATMLLLQDISYFNSSTIIGYFKNFNITNDLTVTIEDKLSINITNYLIQPNLDITLNNGTIISLINSYSFELSEILGEHFVQISGTTYYGNLIQHSIYYITGADTINSTLEIIDPQFNEDSVYKVSMVNFSAKLRYQFTTSTRNTTVSILPGKGQITVSDVKTSRLFKLDLTDYMNIIFRNASSIIEVNNQNFNLNFSYFGEILVKSMDRNISFTYNYGPTNTFVVHPGLYQLNITTQFTIGSIIIEIKRDGKITIPLNIINRTGIINIKNAQINDRDNFHIYHKILEHKTDLVYLEGTKWVVRNFPIGEINLILNRGNKLITFSGYYDPTIEQLEFILNPENIDFSVEKLINLSDNIQVDLASEFSSSQSSGPFGFLRLLLVTETLAISILLLVNIIGVFVGLTFETSKEIRVLRGIGMTENQILMTILSDAAKASVPIIGLGSLIGIWLAQILFIIGNTTLFGFNFRPNFQLEFIILNFLMIIFITLIGSRIGLKLLPYEEG